MTPRIVLFGLLALAPFGCDKNVVELHATTAAIDRIELGRGYEGDHATGVGTSFAPGDTSLHAVIAVSAVPPDTKITGSWIAVEAAGVKDQLIDRSEYRAPAGTASVHYTLTNDKPWPAGRYRFDVQIEGQSLQSREFTIGSNEDRVAFGAAPVEPTAVAAAPVAAGIPVATAPSHPVAHAPSAAPPRPSAPASDDVEEAPAAEPELDAEATPAAAAPAKASKSYAASVTGMCEKMVDCGCEQSVSACSTTLAGLVKLPASVKKCALKYDCSGLCGTAAQHCVTDHYAAEAEITRQIGEMSRKQRENWPTGDGKHCPSGYHRVGDTCYSD